MMNDSPPQTAWIGLGSNLGDRERYLLEALARLDALPGIRVEACSHLYETDPVGYLEQPAFLNMAARLETVLHPQALLHTLLQIERELGRRRNERWGPRTIDLDLLLYGTTVMDNDELSLPHPRMMERLFVLIPLRDLFPDGRLPAPEHADLNEWIGSLEGKEGVIFWKPCNWPAASVRSENSKA